MVFESNKRFFLSRYLYQVINFKPLGDRFCFGVNCFQLKIEKVKKEICRIFANNKLRITIEANKKTVNILDVTLDLTTERFKPYSKPATTPLYVHSKSNHPPNIIRNIPKAINKRLSEISSDKDAFNEAAPLYQEALRTTSSSTRLRKDHQTQIEGGGI